MDHAQSTDAERANWQRVRALFDAAADLPESEWPQHLLRACPDDERLRAGALALLRADAEATQGLGRAVRLSIGGVAPDLLSELSAADSVANDACTGSQLGAWQLLRPIGSGGMGSVYLAERCDGEYQLQAAVKLITARSISPELQRRFLTERQILAQLDHPNIARLLDGGRSPDGQPFLVLEYVEGRSIVEHCDALRMSIKDRLRLFREVCAAVAHAHRRLVVHRDLKPSNVLVSSAGQVKLLDFGVAKLLDIGADAALTGTGLAPLTPAYAAPEQLRGEPASTQTDVYGLGLLLYELLTGLLPHRGRKTGSAASISEVLTTEPIAPSSAVRAFTDQPEQREQIATHRGTRSSALVRSLRGDLDAILLRALRTRALDRYESVEQLDADLGRLLDQKPVHARRGTRRYRLQRFVLRRRWAVASVLAAFVGLLGALAHSELQSQRIAAERDRALLEQSRTAAALEFLNSIYRQANPALRDGEEPRASELLLIGENNVRDNPDMDPSVRATLWEAFARARSGLGNRESALERYQLARELRQALGEESAVLALDLAIASHQYDLGLRDQAEERLSSVIGHPLFSDLALADRTRALRMRGVTRGNRGEINAAVADLLSAAAALFEENGYVDTPYLLNIAPAANYLAAAERYAEAEQLLNRSRQLWEDHPSPTGEGELSLHAALAVHQLRSRNYPLARPHVDWVLAFSLQRFGENHPQTALAYSHQGWMHTYDGRLDEALQLRERAVEIYEQHAGPAAPTTLNARLRRAASLLLKERIEDALTEARDVHQITADPLRGEPQQAHNAQVLVVHALAARGEIGAAAELASELLRTASPETAVGVESLRRLQALAIAGRQEPELDPAECRAIRDITPGPLPVDRVTLALYYADCLRQRGDPVWQAELPSHDAELARTLQADYMLLALRKRLGLVQ